MEERVIVIGLGLSGCAAAEYLLRQGATVLAWDDQLESVKQRPQVAALLQRGMQLADPANLPKLFFAVLSPGVPPEHSLVKRLRKEGVPVIGEVELAAREVKQPVLGITGTNGKTTTTLMVAHVLNHAGIPARAVGNVGVPFSSELDELNRKQEVAVLELSSYQLETLNQPILDAAAVLNITPDHLDRYASMYDYAAAKGRIRDCLKPGAPLFVQPDLPSQFPELFPVEHVYSLVKENLEPLIAVGYRVDSGYHITNVLAAYALCHKMGVPEALFVEALASFKKPAHRMECLGTVRGITYYNDSKGTNVAAVEEGVRTLEGNVVLIAGGQDKGTSFASWKESLSGKVKAVVVMGQAAQKIKQELTPVFPVSFAEGLERALDLATAEAQPGDSVVLSPGCASFDMFKDYVHRGNAFKQLVTQLIKGEK